MPDGLTERQRRLIDAALVLAVIALGFVVLGFAANVFYAFGDVLLLFFLAWLLSFALLPLINGLTRLIPRLSQAGAVIVVYLTIVVVLLAILVQASATLVSSINQFIQDAPNLEDQLTNFLTELQDRLAGFGFQVDLVGQAPQIVTNLQHWASELVGPLQSIAVASIGVFGSILILVILSIYIAVDRDEIVAFLYRLVPPRYVTEARLLQTSTSKSFGGFLRGQVVMGLFFGLLTAIVNIVFGLPVRSRDHRRGRPAPDDPVLRAVRVLAAPGRRRPAAQARRRAARPDRDGHRVVRDDERHLAAADVGRRRHPPDRRPGVGGDRRQDRRHRRRHLRDPDRRRAVGVLLLLVRPVARRAGRSRTARHSGWLPARAGR